MNKKNSILKATSFAEMLRFVYLPVPIPVFSLTEWIVKNTPEEYKTSIFHLLDMKMNFYKALNSLLTSQIKRLEELKKELEKPKREKVKVE